MRGSAEGLINGDGILLMANKDSAELLRMSTAVVSLLQTKPWVVGFEVRSSFNVSPGDLAKA